MTTPLQRLAYRQAARTERESGRCLALVFEQFGYPESLIDVGCGDGHLVRMSAAAGVLAFGVDVALPAPSVPSHGVLLQGDLTKPWGESLEPAEMVLCWEVAEHLPAAAAETLCDTLARLTKAGGKLLFTAAVPGQGGAGHLNEQPHTYWRSKLAARGYRWDEMTSRIVARRWLNAAPHAWWYGQNVQVFWR